MNIIVYNTCYVESIYWSSGTQPSLSLGGSTQVALGRKIYNLDQAWVEYGDSCRSDFDFPACNSASGWVGPKSKEWFFIRWNIHATT